MKSTRTLILACALSLPALLAAEDAAKPGGLFKNLGKPKEKVEEKAAAKPAEPKKKPVAAVAKPAPEPKKKPEGLLVNLRKPKAPETPAAVEASLVPAAASSSKKVNKAAQPDPDVTTLLDELYGELDAKIQGFNAPELQTGALAKLPPVPANFAADWNGTLTQSFFPKQAAAPRSVEQAYALSLENSPRVRAFGRIPLVQETGIQEALGEFDLEFFADGDLDHTDEPTGSILTTGETGRFVQDNATGEYGLRKRLASGGELRLGHRLSTLENNSEFLDPNPQTGSEVVLSIVQPVLRGGGYDYVQGQLRIAHLDSDFAAMEFLHQLEDHLMEVNRAYWGVYLTRAAFIQRQRLLGDTESIVSALEGRTKLDEQATTSELYRARAELNRRSADLRRTEMAVRTAEQRLRSLLNDPNLPLGAAGELIPVTCPILGMPMEDVKQVAREALNNRAEVIQSGLAVRSSFIRRNMAWKEMKPQLDLVAETSLAGIDAGRDLRGALDDQNEHGAGWRVGFRYSMPIEKNLYTARFQRRELEFQQHMDQFRVRAEDVLLEAIVAYQDVITAYQDMSGKYQSVSASRAELTQLRDRLKLDDEQAGKAISYQLQLILDAMERNQVSEEEFLVSVVAYNTSLATLQRVKGSFLQYQNVEILRQEDADPATGIDALLVRSGVKK